VWLKIGGMSPPGKFVAQLFVFKKERNFIFSCSGTQLVKFYLFYQQNISRLKKRKHTFIEQDKQETRQT